MSQDAVAKFNSSVPSGGRWREHLEVSHSCEIFAVAVAAPLAVVLAILLATRRV